MDVGENEKAAGETSERELKSALGDRNIVLVGIMGAGKSTVGRRLAARLALPFTDTDDEIEKAAGQSIEEIFRNYGESAFRDGERKVIARLMKEGPMVLATGGGAFMNDETRDLILKEAVSVWLDASFETVMERVKRRDHRPILKQPDPEGVMRRLLEVRNPVYAKADLRVLSRPVPHQQIVDEVLEELKEHLL